MDYRIQILIRRRGEPVFTSCQLKSEDFRELDELTYEAGMFIELAIEEDLEGRDED